MYQIILTPEALKHTGIGSMSKILMRNIKKGIREGIEDFTIIAVEGVTNVQLGNLLKPVWKTDVTLIITNNVPKDKLHELTDETDIETILVDRDYPQN